VIILMEIFGSEGVKIREKRKAETNHTDLCLPSDHDSLKAHPSSENSCGSTPKSSLGTLGKQDEALASC
jgi:hypothetical protein